MSGEQIILLIILAFAIWAVFYVADDFREIFAEDAPDDDPYLNRIFREIEDAARKDTGGKDAASSSALGTNGSHSHDGTGV